jgi:hypothetical protein
MVGAALRFSRLLAGLMLKKASYPATLAVTIRRLAERTMGPMQ